MQITKIGHCCLAIKDQGLTILTDPGTWTDGQNQLTGIDIILITHEHQDHFHIDSVKKVLQNNPSAKIVTNSAVGKLLDKEGVIYQILEHGHHSTFGSVLVEGFGEKHADIYSEIPVVENTGYFISNKLFYPGDAFTDPGKPVEVLALPVVGPWMHMAEALNYAIKIKPKVAFPVHDGMLKITGPFHLLPRLILEPKGITFKVPGENEVMEF